jgi:hypothetical protein
MELCIMDFYIESYLTPDNSLFIAWQFIQNNEK